MRARGVTRSARIGGFTLIELLVALTLFGVISVVLFGGLRFGTRVWEAGDARAQALAEVEAVQGILRRYMSQAVVPQPFGRPVRGPKPFLGEADRLRLVTIAPAHIGVGGLYQVEIAMADDPSLDEQSLELKWTLYRADEPKRIQEVEADEDTLVGGRRTLLTGVQSIAFRYYGERGFEFGDSDWESEWQEDELLPQLISLKVEFAEGFEQFWPELIVRTRLSHAGQ